MMITGIDEGRFAAACLPADPLADWDDEAVRAEFEAIIAASWPPRQRVGAPPACLIAPAPRTRFSGAVGPFRPYRDSRPVGPQSDIGRRQRSPPRML